VESLISALETVGLPRHRITPLLASLNAANALFDSGKVRAGISQLHAFQHKVRAQWGRSDDVFASQLIQSAQQIIDKALQERNL
jgi:hypothetical protein